MWAVERQGDRAMIHKRVVLVIFWLGILIGWAIGISS